MSEVLIGAMRMTGFGATGTIKDGAVTVNIGQATGLRRQARRHDCREDGRRQARRRTSRRRIDGALAQAPLKDLLDIGVLSGKANASIEMSGSGATWGELVHSIAGSASIAIADGTLDGIDMKAIATRMVDPLAEPMPPGERLGTVRQARRDAGDRQQHSQPPAT